jgi:hypothetical protein
VDAPDVRTVNAQRTSAARAMSAAAIFHQSTTISTRAVLSLRATRSTLLLWRFGRAITLAQSHRHEP